ncbi:MAG: hypothetical protein IT307_13995 [Chloroflexi bacterium]|nr:hypothetical protein [Chloroflexota bacterium]
MKEDDPSGTNRQRGEPELDDICRRCGAPDQFYCCCLTTPPPLGKYPYKIAISRDELALALRHRARTGEPIQRFVRRLIWEAARAEDPDQPAYPSGRLSTGIEVRPMTTRLAPK